jgi:hypothetical protein
MSEHDLNTVVPRLYAALPNSVPVDLTLSGDDSPAESKLAGDLVVLYGFDMGTHFRIANVRISRSSSSPFLTCTSRP